MCAIPQLVSAPLNPIPIAEHFRTILACVKFLEISFSFKSLVFVNCFSINYFSIEASLLRKFSKKKNNLAKKRNEKNYY